MLVGGSMFELLWLNGVLSAGSVLLVAAIVVVIFVGIFVLHEKLMDIFG